MPQAFYISSALADLTVDVSLTSAARGDLLYRGATKWNNLAAGTSGKVLQTNGAGADPSWVTVDLTTLVTLAPASVDRNLIQPTADADHGLVTKNFSATLTGATPYEHRLSTGGVVLGWSPDGSLGVGKAPVTGERASLLAAASDSFVFNGQDSTGGTAFAVGNGGGAYQVVTLNSNFSGSQVMQVWSQGPSQSANTIEIYTFNTDTVFTADKDFNMDWYRAASDTTQKRVAHLGTAFLDNTAATWKGRLILSAVDSGGAREGLRIDADGSAARIGFLGATAVVRQTAAAAAADLATVITLANSLRTGLIADGLFA